MTTRPVVQGYRAINDQVVLADWNGQVLDEARWQQETIAGTNPVKVAGAAVAALPQSARSLLTNGGFEIYQRTVGPVTASPGGASIIIADGWECFNGTSFQRTTLGVDGSQYALVGTTILNNPLWVRQIVYGAERYRGRAVTLTARVYSPDGGAGSVYMSDGANYGVGDTNAMAVGPSYTTLRCILSPVSASATTIEVGFVSFPHATATPSIYFDNWMLTPTNGSVPYQPLPPALEWMRCYARYQKRDWSVRFRSLVAGEVRRYHIPYWGGAMTQLPPGGFCSLSPNGTNGVDYNNLSGAPAISAILDTGAIVDITANLAGTQTWINKGTFVADGGIY